MGLTAYKSIRLEDAKLIKFFEDEKDEWRTMADHAYRYTAEFLTDTGEEVRPDDVIDVLVPALEVSKKLRKRLASDSLTQKYWFTYFGDLIIDRLWSELTKGQL